MEAEVRKFQQKFKKVREEMGRWGELQVRLVSQVRNASSIMDRLQVLSLDFVCEFNVSCFRFKKKNLFPWYGQTKLVISLLGDSGW